MRITPLQEASDASLAISVARWDEAALAEVYRRYGAAVYGLARRVLRNETLAEDVTQEVFVAFWNAPERFDAERGSLRAYLLAQSHRRSVDLIRAEEARRAREERDALKAVVPDVDLDRELLELAAAEQVRTALAALSTDEREAIELAYFGGKTYREVAAELQAPEGTVKSRIRAGLGRLRDALAEMGAGP